MAKLSVDIGTIANDGTGDTLRTAGNKINQNFTEVYDKVGTDGSGNLTRAASNTYVQTLLANTNAYISTVQSNLNTVSARERTALGNTNSYIASVQTNLNGVQNSLTSQISSERAALANTNTYIASVITSVAGKLPLAGGTMNGAISMGINKITDLGTPTLSTDATTKAYVDSQVATGGGSFLNLSGGTLVGALAMSTNKITGLGDPASAQDAATKNYVDTNDALKLSLTGGTMSGAIAMGTNKITGMGDPGNAQDAATKNYVDTQISGVSGSGGAVDSITGTTNQIVVAGTSTIPVLSFAAPLTTPTATVSGTNTTGISSFNISNLLGLTSAMTIDAIRHDNSNAAGDSTTNFSPALRIKGAGRQARILYDGGQELVGGSGGNFEIQTSTSAGSLDIGIGFKTTTGDDRNTTSSNKIRAHSRIQIEAHNTTSGTSSQTNSREAALIISGIRNNTSNLGGQSGVDWSPALRIRGSGRQARITFDGGAEIVGGTSDVMNLEGTVQINGTTQSGSDYAEYFETTDGLAIANGTPVVLVDGKISAANSTVSTDQVIGVIRPPRSSSSVGGSDLGEWHNKYLKTVWGDTVRTKHVYYQWTTWDINEEGENRPTEHTVTAWNDVPPGQEYEIVTNYTKTINPDYDETLEYQTREERPEWQIVGLVGQVQILSGSPTNPRWIKMKDIDEDHELWYIR